jgi:hypothetical protein
LLVTIAAFISDKNSAMHVRSDAARQVPGQRVHHPLHKCHPRLLPVVQRVVEIKQHGLQVGLFGGHSVLPFTGRPRADQLSVYQNT